MRDLDARHCVQCRARVGVSTHARPIVMLAEGLVGLLLVSMPGGDVIMVRVQDVSEELWKLRHANEPETINADM